MPMITEVLVVLALPTKLSVILVYSTRYDTIMPLRVIGGSHITKIDVELALRAVTLIGAPGAKIKTSLQS